MKADSLGYWFCLVGKVNQFGGMDIPGSSLARVIVCYSGKERQTFSSSFVDGKQTCFIFFFFTGVLYRNVTSEWSSGDTLLIVGAVMLLTNWWLFLPPLTWRPDFFTDRHYHLLWHRLIGGVRILPCYQQHHSPLGCRTSQNINTNQRKDRVNIWKKLKNEQKVAASLLDLRVASSVKFLVQASLG